MLKKNRNKNKKQYSSAAPKRRVSKKKKRQRIIIGIIIALFAFSVGTFVKNKIDDQKQIWEQNQIGKIEKVDADKKVTDDNGNEVATDFNAKVTVLNVGDGDAIFIKNGSTEALIDTGDGSSDTVSKFVSSETSGNLDYLIITNCINSSAGGLKNVINETDIDTFIYGYAPSKDSSFYSSFNDCKSKLKQNETSIKKANNQTIDLEDGITITVQKGLNEGSDGDKTAICLISYKNEQFVISGNASDKLLKAKLSDFSGVFAYVASASGSESTNTMKFLNRIDPENIIVSSQKPGKSKYFNNDIYNRLEEKGGLITTYQCGNIEFSITRDNRFSKIEKN